MIEVHITATELGRDSIEVFNEVQDVLPEAVSSYLLTTIMPLLERELEVSIWFTS
jgi:hypothetical protein